LHSGVAGAGDAVVLHAPDPATAKRTLGGVVGLDTYYQLFIPESIKICAHLLLFLVLFQQLRGIAGFDS
jgi:hypothetical protein